MRRKNRIHPYHHARWRYKNITITIAGVMLAIILARIPAVHTMLLQLSTFGYISAFVAGMLFVSTFTIATGTLILLTLTEHLSPIGIGLVAGLGAVIGDITIFRFVKNNLMQEIEDIYDNFDRKKHLKKLFHTKYFNWMLPVLGAVIIASPLPDELGVSLLGISTIRMGKFIFLSYFLNSLGIFLILSTTSIFHA